jgi:hypothetical protein
MLTNPFYQKDEHCNLRVVEEGKTYEGIVVATNTLVGTGHSANNRDAVQTNALNHPIIRIDTCENFNSNKVTHILD